MGRGAWIAVLVALAALVALASGPCRVAEVPHGGGVAARAASPNAESASAAAAKARKQQTAVDASAAEAAVPSPVDLDHVDRDRDVHGVVVKKDGSPVAGAEVVAVFHPWRSLGLHLGDDSVDGPRARTASDGTFALRLRRGERANLRVRADGFPVLRTRERIAGERVRIVLQPATRLSVRVVDETNRVVPDLRLALSPSGADKVEATTDAAGVATFDGLPASTTCGAELLSSEWAELGIREFKTGDGPVSEETLVLKKGRTLSGRVVDAADEAPLAGAKVGFNWMCSRPVTTDADGRYALAGWSGVNVREITALADGFARESIEVGAAETVDFKLKRGFTATGRVVDDRGRPLADAKVELVASTFEEHRQRVSFGDAASGADGRFRIGGLDPSMPHVLVVTADAFGRVRVPIPVPLAAKTVDLGDVPLAPGHVLAGRFVDADGKPMAGQWIVLAGPKMSLGSGVVDVASGLDINDYGAEEDAYTDDLGRFAFADLAPGDYVVRTETDGSLACEAKAKLPPDRDLLDVEMKLAPSTAVEFHVVDEKGEPICDAALFAMDGAGAPVIAQTDAKGVARLRIPWDAATVSVSPPYGVTRRFLAADDQQWKKGGVPKPFVLREGAAVQGVVVDPEGKAVAGAQIRVEESGEPARWHETDDSGRFDWVFEKGAKVRLVFDGSAGGADDGLAGAVECSAPQTGVVLSTSKVETDRVLLVKTTTPTGEPVAGVIVEVSAHGWKAPRTATSGADGVARFDALPARTLSVAARATDAWARSAAMDATPSGQQVVVALRKGRTLHGEVVDAAGGPAKARVTVRQGDETVSETATDADGKFALLVPADVAVPTVVAASGDAGYGESEVPSGGAADVKITLTK